MTQNKQSLPETAGGERCRPKMDANRLSGRQATTRGTARCTPALHQHEAARTQTETQGSERARMTTMKAQYVLTEETPHA